MALNNLTDADPADGLVDDPDENNFGGTATFAFDHDVTIGSIKWIDKDHVVDNFVIAYNAAGDVIISVPVPLGANSSVQTIPINADGVRRLVFDYQESGGFVGIEVDCEQATPTPTAQAETPTPTPTLPRRTHAHAVARAHGHPGPHAQPDTRGRDLHTDSRAAGSCVRGHIGEPGANRGARRRGSAGWWRCAIGDRGVQVGGAADGACARPRWQRSSRGED